MYANFCTFYVFIKTADLAQNYYIYGQKHNAEDTI